MSPRAFDRRDREGQAPSNAHSDSVAVTDDTVSGQHGPIPIRRYLPPAGVTPASDATIVWVHGGAFVKGDLELPETHEVAMALARKGFIVVATTYRLATRFALPPLPGRPARGIRYPVPLDDVFAVVSQVQAESPGGVILGGASAGACLSAATVLRMARLGGEPLRGLFAAYGIFHAALPRQSAQLRGRRRGLRRYAHTPATLRVMALNYAGSLAAVLEPEAFPGGHPLHGFPPSLLIDADHDVMRASGEAFAGELVTAQVPVEYHIATGTDHAFLNRPKDPGFGRAIDLIADWARRVPATRT